MATPQQLPTFRRGQAVNITAHNGNKITATYKDTVNGQAVVLLRGIPFTCHPTQLS
ncbi:hypothetical protein GCM10028807_09670 [Spirosoma daeguense]